MKRLFILIFSCVSILPLFAQHLVISGKVTNQNKEILIGASISIYKQDSTWLDGVLSDDKGEFKLNEIPEGSYKIVVSYVGCTAENIQLPNLQKDINLGNISLFPNTELKEVVVSGSSKRYEVNRQILIPVQSLVDISNNAWTLMKNMQLSQININPITNEITTDNGERVLLQINGVPSERAEIMNLKSKDIIRVEYSDQPGVRYQAGAVINYVVRERENGGYIMANANQNIDKYGIGQYTLSGGYNCKKSQLGVVLDYNRSYVK